MAVGGIARLWDLGAAGLWFDELITLAEASRESLWDTVVAKAAHPPLLRVSARWSVALLGDPSTPGGHDFALRLPSALMGTAATGFVFVLARKLSDDNALVGLVAAAAWALLPFGLWYSREARFYAALVLFSAWALHAAAVFVSTRRPGLGRHLYVATPLLLGSFTHYLFAPIFAATAAWVLPSAWRRGRRAWRPLLPWLAAATAFLPWLCWALPRLATGDRSWIEPLGHQLRDLPVRFVTGRLGYFHLHGGVEQLDPEPFRQDVMFACALLLGGGLFLHVLVRRRRWGGHVARFAGGSLLALAVLHVGSPTMRFFDPKYLAFLHPFACLALGELVVFIAGVETRPSVWRSLLESPLSPHTIGRLAAGVIVVVTVCSAAPHAVRALHEVYGRTYGSTRPTVHRQQYDRAARWVALRRGDAPVYVLDGPRGYNELALRYYGLDDPIRRWPRDPAERLCPSNRGASGRAFVVMSHRSSMLERRDALCSLRKCFGPKKDDETWPGVEGEVVVVVLGADAAEP